MTTIDIDAFLRDHGIVAARHEHPAVMTVEESERLVPPLPGAKTKNLFLRDKKGARHFLLTVPAERAVDLSALGAALAVGRLGFASAERLHKHLGIAPGAVSLLALVNDGDGAVEYVIDRSLWEASAVQAHPLVNTATLILSHADLKRFLAATGHTPRVIDVPAAGSAGPVPIAGAPTR
ncbi:MAG TPA: prolyl-tRNA synthetase associated domain-containing protein [Casimicrobiaceae bacterium]